MRNIRWAAIQPLTGGMYIGAEKAIGQPAEYILSFPGLCEKYNNEYHLLKWLKTHNKLPHYACFDCDMFDNDDNILPDIIETQWTRNIGFFHDLNNLLNMDLIVSVPVCSGLTSATCHIDSDRCASRNTNMKWITNYVLGTLQPKVYIFENSPRLMSVTGKAVREYLEDLAIKNGYSICYYITDTQYHHNPQKRARTFILFFKGAHAPELGYEHNEIDIIPYLSQIPDDSPQNVCVKTHQYNHDLMKYAISILGDDAFSKFNSVSKWIVSDNRIGDIRRWMSKNEHSKYTVRFINHIEEKSMIGKNWYDVSYFRSHDNKTHAIVFKTMRSELHPIENRIFTIREQLHLMGMPNDFYLYGDIQKTFPQIGQNVPVGTAEWIVSQAIQHMNDDGDGPMIRVFNNIKMKEV